MKSYEGLFVFPPESAPEARKNQISNLEGLISKFKGQVQQKLEVGRKPFGYPVRKFQEGHFLVYDFDMDPSQAPEFRKALQLQEELIKYMIILKKKVKAEKKPSVPKPTAAVGTGTVPSPKPVRPSTAPAANA